MGPLVEVQSGVVRTWEGEEIEVHGGAWLSPEAVLSTHGELQKARHREAPLPSVPVIIGAALVGAALGFWLGRRSVDD